MSDSVILASFSGGVAWFGTVMWLCGFGATGGHVSPEWLPVVAATLAPPYTGLVFGLLHWRRSTRP